MNNGAYFYSENENYVTWITLVGSSQKPSGLLEYRISDELAHFLSQIPPSSADEIFRGVPYGFNDESYV